MIIKKYMLSKNSTQSLERKNKRSVSKMTESLTGIDSNTTYLNVI